MLINKMQFRKGCVQQISNFPFFPLTRSTLRAAIKSAHLRPWESSTWSVLVAAATATPRKDPPSGDEEEQSQESRASKNLALLNKACGLCDLEKDNQQDLSNNNAWGGAELAKWLEKMTVVLA